MPLSERIRKLAEKFNVPDNRPAQGPSSPVPAAETTSTSSTKAAEPPVCTNSANDLAPPWSTINPLNVMGSNRAGANSYKINYELLSEALAQARPIPTNAWWQNLALENGDQPVVTAPYMIKCLHDSMVICMPTVLGESKFVASVWHDDWKVHLPGCHRQVVDYDELSVTVGYSGPTQATVPLVKGAAFATIIMESPLELKLSTVHAITNVDVSLGATLVRLNNDMSWLIVCENGELLQQSGTSELSSIRNVQGAVRLALVANQRAASAMLSAKEAVPMGGSVSINVENEDAAEFTINWKVRGSGDPLLCALPHHQRSLLDASWEDAVGGFWTYKGQMQVVRGCQWRWREYIEPLGFAGSTPLTSEHKEKLQELVSMDVQSLPQDTANLPPDPYFFGKALARAARIALIADEVGDGYSRDLALGRAIEWFTPWIDGTNPNPLVYDTEWRGIVSKAGLNDPYADFGQGRYNDHHFHYGYFIYAAAVIAKLNPQWIAEHQDSIDLLVRDYCNLNSSDSSFPLLRCFDMYEGSSWAAGLFPFADSRNQESTSEAINAYYGAYLYAQVTNRLDIARVIRGMLQLEARAARTYWHLDDLASDLYPDVYACDKAIVGILWSSKIDYATFFGANPEFIYGIQFLPYTPASSLLIKSRWIDKIWPRYLQAVADESQTESWREIIDLTYGVVDKNKTLERISNITNHDDGNSASNSYYWVATCSSLQ
ncbi:hypothetical protein IWW36_000436 [Coemansia brasiliensis]|uniref:glucan endo-1,3-beta-D-glucosidase n=1 Tax=Coemansia brasiliensis TaxID=2650707 RepID=A0A9W8IDK2_9FUNG|nr:hypothetical protein IWW36_000436 [Coemansia brasiliensis]